VVGQLRGDAFGVAVLDTRSDGSAGITVFHDLALSGRVEGGPSSAPTVMLA
jgi:hypothetical protein